MDRALPFVPAQQKWNEFVGKFGQALEDWRQNNNNKIPTDIQKREIARGILFPNGTPNQPATAPPASGKPAQRLQTAPGDNPENSDPFSLWIARQLQAHGRVVSEETISAAKRAMIAKNPNIEKEYSLTNIVPVQKAGD